MMQCVVDVVFDIFFMFVLLFFIRVQLAFAYVRVFIYVSYVKIFIYMYVLHSEKDALFDFEF